LLIGAVAYVVHAVQTSTAVAEDRSIILVRILELTGTGPDKQSHLLFSSKEGYTTTMDALGRVGSQVNGTQLADGDYHTLFVTLADDYQRLAQDGSTQGGSLTEDGKPLKMRVHGMIVVEKGHATATRMIESPSYYGYPKGYRGDDDD